MTTLMRKFEGVGWNFFSQTTTKLTAYVVLFWENPSILKLNKMLKLETNFLSQVIECTDNFGINICTKSCTNVHSITY